MLSVDIVRLWSGLDASTRERVFIVDLLDSEGAALNIWTGADYLEAIACARGAAAEHGCEMVADVFGGAPNDE